MGYRVESGRPVEHEEAGQLDAAVHLAALTPRAEALAALETMLEEAVHDS